MAGGEDDPLTHAGFVYDLIGQLPRPETVSEQIALAQVHATMALVEAIESWSPPRPEDEPVPVEETPEGWAWQRG